MCTPVTPPICFSYVYHPIHQRLSCFVCCSLFYVNIPQIFLPCFWDNTIYYLIQCLRFTITNKVWGTYGQSFMDWKARKTENLWDHESCLIWWLEPSLHHLKSRLSFLVSDLLDSEAMWIVGILYLCAAILGPYYLHTTI